MIQNKKILRFGVGNIVVTATINALLFKEIDAMKSVGDIIELKNYDDIILVKDATAIPFKYYSEIQEFKKLLTDAYETKTFEFKDVIFDFSNYMRKSIDCILDQLTWIEHFIPKSQAI